MVADNPNFPPPGNPHIPREKVWDKPTATIQDVTGKPVGYIDPDPKPLPSVAGSTIDEIKKAAEESCNVHKPSHYQILPGVEVIDVRKALFKKIPEGTTAFAIDAYSRSWEYLTRMWGKNGLEDAKKARVYLNWLIEELESSVDKL